MITVGGRAHSLEQIEAVGELGYPFAEIDVNDPDKVNGELQDLLSLKETYGLTYLAHFPNEGDPRNLDRLSQVFVPKMKRLFGCARDLGIEKGTMHFWVDRRLAPPDLIKGKIELLSELVDAAVGKGMVLCLENLTCQYDSFQAVMDQIPKLRMTMDIGHGELLSEENASFGFLDHLFHKIEHVHVHDNRGGTTVKDDLHLPLGDGIVDYPRILTRLREKGYRSTLTMEVRPEEMAQTQAALDPYIR